MAKPIFNLARVCTRPVRQSIFDFARYASIAGALCATSPVFAGSDEENLANQTGDDPTHPLGKIELLDRFTTAPGPGTAEGTTKQVDTNTLFARIEIRSKSRRSGNWLSGKRSLSCGQIR